MQLGLEADRQYPYLVAPVAVLDTPHLTNTEKLVVLVLCSFADQHGRCHTSQVLLAERASLTARTITTVLDALINKGVIQADGAGVYLPFMDVFSTHTPCAREEAEPLAAPADSPLEDDIREVFDYWRDTLHHPQAHLTKVRRDKIARRLREGLSVHDAKRVIDACAASPFHCGANDGHKRYDTLEANIFVSREKVEWWLSQTEPSSMQVEGREHRIRHALEALSEGWNPEEARVLVLPDEWPEVERRLHNDDHRRKRPPGDGQLALGPGDYAPG